MKSAKVQNWLQRKRRVRSTIHGTAARPRMSIRRSLSQIDVQLIDDDAGKTLAYASTKELKKAKPNADGAKALGELIAKKAKDANIETIVFDRNGYKYHGRIQQLADAAREGGLKF